MFNLVFLGVKTAADIHEHLESGKYEGICSLPLYSDRSFSDKEAVRSGG